MTNVLVLGASGMLGNAIFRYFSNISTYTTFGSLRNDRAICLFDNNIREFLVSGVDLENTDHVINLFLRTKPNVVINCVGLVKQLSSSEDPLLSIPINSVLPHRLSKLCSVIDARFIHFSTDCVYSGLKGLYNETDSPDANDLYGRSKLIGEVEYPNSITLRTSIIGHELAGSRSLIDWFLSQDDPIKGYKKAVFSGLPTVEIARIVQEFVIPNTHLQGLYHLSAEPINKFDLLSMVAKVYNKKIHIQADESFIIDRSLNSDRFRTATGFVPEAWGELVKRMHAFR